MSYYSLIHKKNGTLIFAAHDSYRGSGLKKRIKISPLVK